MSRQETTEPPLAALAAAAAAAGLKTALIEDTQLHALHPAVLMHMLTTKVRRWASTAIARLDAALRLRGREVWYLPQRKPMPVGPQHL